MTGCEKGWTPGSCESFPTLKLLWFYLSLVYSGPLESRLAGRALISISKHKRMFKVLEPCSLTSLIVQLGHIHTHEQRTLTRTRHHYSIFNFSPSYRTFTAQEKVAILFLHLLPLTWQSYVTLNQTKLQAETDLFYWKITGFPFILVIKVLRLTGFFSPHFF